MNLSVRINRDVNRLTQKCRRAHSLHHRPYPEGSADRPDILDWKYAVQSAVSHGHVLLLWRFESCRAVLQRDGCANSFQPVGIGGWKFDHSDGVSLVVKW